MRDGDFHVRGKEISRVEGLSDAVFGFAITLLVVSLEVPHTAGEVLHAMRGFFAFAITFSLLFAVWRMQFGFFRRYGLEDSTTVKLTGVLLFVILFFVYPLKFVFGAIVDRLLMHAGFLDRASTQPISGPDFNLMYIAFSLGWSAVLGVFALLYRHAYRMRHELQLTPLEVFDTREALWRVMIAALPGIILAAMTIGLYAFPQAENVIVYPVFAVLILLVVAMRRHRGGYTARRQAAVEAQRTDEVIGA
jgi:hypothetical protein